MSHYRIPEKFDVTGVGEYAQPRAPDAGRWMSPLTRKVPIR